jgi:hypothetical protein
MAPPGSISNVSELPKEMMDEPANTNNTGPWTLADQSTITAAGSTSKQT